MDIEITVSLLSILPSLIKGVISLFIIVDPVGNIPIFIGLTQKMNKNQRDRTFKTAVVTGLLLLLAFAISGQQILIFFGISIYSFMIAGGVLLLIISIRILIGWEWREAEAAPESIGAVPIACPLLVGPGAITNTILNLQTIGFIPTLLSTVIIFIIVWLILRFIDPIYMFLGRTGSLVISRVMAMFIAAIAIQYILVGMYHSGT